MNKNILAAVMAALLVFVGGCSMMTSRSKTVPVEVGQSYQLAIVEGKTTKQEIIDVLGLPESITSSLTYRFYRKDTCKLTLTQKDGTALNLILGRQPGCKYDSMTVYMNDDGVVRSVILT